MAEREGWHPIGAGTENLRRARDMATRHVQLPLRRRSIHSSLKVLMVESSYLNKIEENCFTLEQSRSVALQLKFVPAENLL